PPTGRYVLVSGCDAWIERDGQRFPLSTQCYTPGVTSPDGERRLETFSLLPWPSWRYRLEDGTEVEQQLFAVRGSPRVVLSWSLEAASGVAADGRPELSAEIARLRAAERARRDAFPTSLHRAADAYLVRRGAGMTIVAGYPWFTDWGRDTFIALRGLCLAGGRWDDARGILLQWADAVSQGMLPHRFPDSGAEPEFNAVD